MGGVELFPIKQIIILTLKFNFCLSFAGVSSWSRKALQIGTFLGMRAPVHLKSKPKDFEPSITWTEGINLSDSYYSESF